MPALHQFQIEIPPLRSRPEDIVVLAKRLLVFFGKSCHKSVQGFTAAALEQLKDYGWPGNIRELRNVIERAVILCQSDRIGVGDLPDNLKTGETPVKLGDPVSLDKIEEEHIRSILAATRSLQEAAAVLGIDQATLWRRRKQYGI